MGRQAGRVLLLLLLPNTRGRYVSFQLVNSFLLTDYVTEEPAEPGSRAAPLTTESWRRVQLGSSPRPCRRC